MGHNCFKMAVVGGALLDKFIGTSEAEKAFQPWWDTVEDFLVYGLIMLGKIQIEIAKVIQNIF